MIPNAAVLIAACVVLWVEPANGRIVALVGGLTVMLVINAVLLRHAFAPLVRLTSLMEAIDPLNPGRRIPPLGPESEVNGGRGQDPLGRFGDADVTAHDLRAAAQQQQGDHSQRKADATSGGEDVDHHRHAPQQESSAGSPEDGCAPIELDEYASVIPDRPYQ